MLVGDHAEHGIEISPLITFIPRIDNPEGIERLASQARLFSQALSRLVSRQLKRWERWRAAIALKQGGALDYIRRRENGTLL